MKIFEATKVMKRIDDFQILANLSLSIHQGERIAITGQNGSGKSSLLKLIGGIYEETSGKVWRDQLRIAYVPEHFPETIRFKLYEYLMLMGKMNGQSKSIIHEAITQFANRFAISHFLSTPLKKCSKGTKQKAGIIQALLMKPELLLMDEPLTGLDDDSQKELVNQLNQLPAETTIIFTAHDSLLIDHLAHRVIRVDDGAISSDTYKQQKERVLLIRARIPSKEVITDMQLGPQKFVGDNLVDLLVLESESDQALRLLLERGCSILEVIEKR
ncbi:ABC transporter ATP-binding protein [Bacillus sp. DNRA2]|uniref:ATP-binding cassette domain-containing protein n=1 Tax=Bacillus sp. DNRA2 TaxID=2723053 RepID=UPI00145EDA62|nr:ABC transporter ATP-binding protein [Bacillus sp. DNRA2]NMD71001.1 ABC transporter ATP-binding protein [Bacillus sp. DNRA2]